MAPPPVIFLGPSLPLAEAQRELPDGVFLPPIRRGGLLPLLDDPPSAIGIVDGEFFQSFAISTQEILLYLERGVPVFGASSMGALRAVELEPHGMVGVGEVFEMFRDGRLEADDEVAMTFCPETLRPLSEPMVNFRVALAQGCREGLLSRRECRLLTMRLKAAYFPERTVPRLFRELRRLLTPERAARIQDWWCRSAPNVKAADARSLLRRIRSACTIVESGTGSGLSPEA
ncbi:MAG TPA: TfuA-like protein [Vicinamibacterales bacterium]|nr:TfuA-like protein [Vicinamibacterales bacterium]